MLILFVYLSFIYHAYNLPNWNFNNSKIKKQVHNLIAIHSPSKMPTGSKGLMNQLSNMVAPQVSGQGNTKSTRTIVTIKKNKTKAQELFKKKDFPPLLEPSSTVQENQNDKVTSSDKTKGHTDGITVVA